MRLEGKVALVTGGSGGIGRAVSIALAAEGATVVVNYNKSAQQAAETVGEILKENGSAQSMQADVGSGEQVRRMIVEILRRHERIDILVNNAGVARDSLLYEMDDSEWDLVLRTNLTGVYNCIKAVIRPMMVQGDGRIINVSSVLAERPWRGVSSYAASKGAVNSFTKAVAVELAAKGIRVNAVAPGLISTGLTARFGQAVQNKTRELIPMRRPGLPEEVASLVVFLASDEASYITGKILGVDGGLI
jgi:3-oxoacyl-[acyl-carrier protein] reductase